MASQALEKTAEEPRKEIAELERQQWEITERLRNPRELRRTSAGTDGPRLRGVTRPAPELEEQPVSKRRLSSAVVKGDGEKRKYNGAEEEDPQVQDSAVVVGASFGGQSNRVRHESGQINGGLRRDVNIRLRKTDYDAIPTETAPRVLPKEDDPNLVKKNRRILGQKYREEDKQLSSTEAYMSRSDSLKRVSMSRTTEQYGNGDFDSMSKMKATEEALDAKDKDKQKPSFELSGKLAEETNRVRGITLLFNEPSDACKPDIRWRLYVFKAGEVLNEPLYVHRQSCYLFGRERRVADIPTDHPSCSKQHAVLQYRSVDKEQADELISKQVRPYLMDLGSTNGTFINENRIEPQRYYELFEKDTIKFGNSRYDVDIHETRGHNCREYVMLHENSAG